jgi:NAD+ kinase
MSKRPQNDRKDSLCMVHNLVDRSTSQQEQQEQQKNAQTGSLLAQIKEEIHVPIDKHSLPNDDASPPTDAGATQSRLLTKIQLSDMAMSVRSLSKKLRSLKVKLKIRSVFLLTKAHDQTLIGKTQDVARWLLSKERDVPYIVYVENTLEHNKNFDAAGLLAEDPTYDGRLKYWDNALAKRRPHTFDFVITLGGDGTVLYASWLFQRVVPPVLSFALGSLGFLTKFDFNQFEKILTNTFRDGVTISLRLRLEGTIMRSSHMVDKGHEHHPKDLVDELVKEEGDDHQTHKPEKTFEILNDIVVDRGPNPSMNQANPNVRGMAD